MTPSGVDHLKWLSSYSGTIKAEACQVQDFGMDTGLVRDLSHNGVLHIFHDSTYVSAQYTTLDGTTKAPYQNMDSYLLDRTQRQFSQGVPDCCLQLDGVDPNQVVLMKAKRLPKRADFLHQVSSDNVASAKKPRLQCFRTNECEVGRLPFSYSRSALFVPSIIHKVHIVMVVDSLCNTVPWRLHFHDQRLVISIFLNNDIPWQIKSHPIPKILMKVEKNLEKKSIDLNQLY